MPSMIFHAPFPVDSDPSVASALRPARMLQAFHSLGYEVFEVTGHADVRQKRIHELKRLLRGGAHFDFLYSESSTMPYAMADPGRRVKPFPLRYPLHPLVDRRLFSLTKQYDVPSGVFYRDIYWAFSKPAVRSRMGKLEDAMVRGLYGEDLRMMDNLVDVVFVPSIEMAKYIPGLHRPEVHALPPGGNPLPAHEVAVSPAGNPLRLIYVGSCGGHYRLEAVFEAVAADRNLQLTACMPQDQWSTAREALGDIDDTRVTIKHLSNAHLPPVYASADVALLYMQPDEYREFAVPVKLFEYIAAGLPIVASEGTKAGQIVEELGVGWTIPYGEKHLRELLSRLSADRDMVKSKGAKTRSVSQENRWEDRAAEAARVLSAVSPRPELHMKPTLLIISHSDIENDARIRKQIDLFSKDYDITVCGLGQTFETDAELLLHPTADTRRTDQLRAALLHAKRFHLAQRLEANNIAARRMLRGRSFDAVIADDIEPVGLAIDLFGADKVHADLHEFYPGLQDRDPAWVALRQPYYEWMLRNQAARAASATTVSQGIADLYASQYGFEAGVVMNARPWMGMVPTQVGDTIKLVHAGASLPNRNIEGMMRAAASATSNVTLDLYLTGRGTPYHDSLRALADELGDRITLHDPVKQDDLVATLNQYDVGVHVLPPTVTNNALALPNKFFDFVQACLGVIVGPTKEMAERVRLFDIGEVMKSFSQEDLAATLSGLTPDLVARWKTNAQAAAHEVDVTSMLGVWKEAVDAIAGKRD